MVSQYLLFLNVIKSKSIFKIVSALLLIAIICAFLFYNSLTNLQKATAKTKFLHTLRLVDSSWKISVTDNRTSLITPTLVVDGIYKSMEGPHASKSFEIDASREELVWLTSFKVEAISTDESEVMSNDYVCHANIDFYEIEHYNKWNLSNRIGKSYPRLTTMSNGIESYQFPKGFGFPVFTNENLFTQTQVLNHNIRGKIIPLKHKIEIGYEKHSKDLKPLRSVPIFIMLPYNIENPYEGPSELNPNACIPVSTSNHSYIDNLEMSYSGHWVISPGKHSYSYDVTEQLALKDTITLHHIATHLHPFAEKLTLIDNTTGSIISESHAENYTDKIGLSNVNYLSNKQGFKMFENHSYKLVLETNNTTEINQDMMASMALFFYDEEMHKKIKEKADL